MMCYIWSSLHICVANTTARGGCGGWRLVVCEVDAGVFAMSGVFAGKVVRWSVREKRSFKRLKTRRTGRKGLRRNKKKENIKD